MLSIGQVYLQKTEDQTRICADISLNGREITLWFGVDPSQEQYLCTSRSDAFVMALLPTAMRDGYDIVSRTPVSSRLKYQLEYYLIPALTAKGDWYHPIRIQGPMDNTPVPNLGGIGWEASGANSRINRGEDRAYPVTHLAVFHLGAFQGEAAYASFRDACDDTALLAREQGLESVWLDSNICDVLPEQYPEVCSFRNLSGCNGTAGAIFRVFSPSDYSSAGFALDVHDMERYDLLTVHCAQTESMTVYLY